MSRMQQYIDDSNYYGDYRVQARNKWYKAFDEKKMMALVTVYTDEDGEEDIELRCRYEVCGVCNGKGSHVNPSIDCNGLTAEDFYEDPDFARDYFGGMYDQTCNGCGGTRVEPVIDEEANDPKLVKLVNDQIEEDREFRRIQEAERRMGA